MHPVILVLIFIVAALVGYKLISNVPSLLHTPLMSGMNALSGVTILGALAATGAKVIVYYIPGVTGMTANLDNLRALLDIPGDRRVRLIICLGYAAETGAPRPKNRKPLDAVVTLR